MAWWTAARSVVLPRGNAAFNHEACNRIPMGQRKRLTFAGSTSSSPRPLMTALGMNMPKPMACSKLIAARRVKRRHPATRDGNTASCNRGLDRDLQNARHLFRLRDQLAIVTTLREETFGMSLLKNRYCRFHRSEFARRWRGLPAEIATTDRTCAYDHFEADAVTFATRCFVTGCSL